MRGSVALRQKMERRGNKRVPLQNTRVYVSAGSGHRCQCRMRNLSTYGAFLEAPALALRMGQKVSITFVVRPSSVAKVHSRDCVVVRFTADGVGVQFLSE